MLVLLVCVLITRPFVEMGVNDDWSFIRTAQVMAQTGHIAYNGWAAMMLGWQVLLGALFIKLFGFSFTVVRIPIFLLALGTTFLLHRLLVRFGLNTWNASLTTLTAVLSPVFLPLVFTFMSDVAGLFCLLLCLYACQRSLQARRASASLGWLYFAALTNIVDGTVRQIAWLGVLVMVPCTAWLLRKRRAMLLHGAGLWLSGIASVLLCIHWFVRQRYAVSEKLLDAPINSSALAHLAQMLARGLMSLLLFSLPVLIIFPGKLLGLPRRKVFLAFSSIFGAMFLLLVYGYMYYRATHSFDGVMLPLLVNLFTSHGIMEFGEVIGQMPVVLHIPLRALATVLTLISGLSFVAYILLSRGDASLKGQQFPELHAPPRDRAGTLTWEETAFLLLPFSLAYLALLTPRSLSLAHTLFDRYLTPLVIVLSVFALRYLQEHSARNTYWLSSITLLLLTFFAVTGTHDAFAVRRARLAAAEEVTQSGVPRTALDGGFEYNGWTQITIAGHVNDPNILPGGIYQPIAQSDARCNSDSTHETPVVKPDYALSFEPFSCFQPSKFAAVPYSTWLPPHGRSIYIQKLK